MIALNIEKNLKIPFHIGTREIAHGSQKGYFFLPFGPEEDSYPINSEDFNLPDRLAKLDRLGEDLKKPIDLSKNPFFLLIDTMPKELNRAGINRVGINKEIVSRSEDFEFPQETLGLLNRLRILLTTPKTRLEGKPWLPFLEKGILIFYKYYPVDTGPLAVSPDYNKSYQFAIQSILRREFRSRSTRRSRTTQPNSGEVCDGGEATARNLEAVISSPDMSGREIP